MIGPYDSLNKIFIPQEDIMISWILKTDPNNSRLIVVSFPGLGALRKFHAGQQIKISNNNSDNFELSDNGPTSNLNYQNNFNNNNSFKPISYYDQSDSFFNRQIAQNTTNKYHKTTGIGSRGQQREFRCSKRFFEKTAEETEKEFRNRMMLFNMYLNETEVIITNLDFVKEKTSNNADWKIVGIAMQSLKECTSDMDYNRWKCILTSSIKFQKPFSMYLFLDIYKKKFLITLTFIVSLPITYVIHSFQ